MWNDEAIPVRALISRKGSDTDFGKAVVSASNLRAGKGEIIAYHGTSASIWNKIKRAGGLVPGLGPDYPDKFPNHSEGLIYLTTEIHQARRYAVRAAKSGNNVVLRVRISDGSKIAFDEDTMSRQALIKVRKRIGEQAFINLVSKAYGVKVTHFGPPNGSYWDSAFYKGEKGEDFAIQIHPTVVFGGGGYRGRTPVDQKAFEDIKKLLAYEAIGIVAESGASFGYKGKIPLKDIEVAETGKSEKYNEYDPRKNPDADEKNKAAYANARANRVYKK
jgi:hypothetical protein